MPNLNTYPLTIISGATVSNIVTLRNQETVVGLLSPTGLPTIPLSFLTSPTKENSLQTFYQDGSEYAISGIADIATQLNPSLFLQTRRLQLRSGLSSAAITQSGVRTFTLITAEL